MRNLRSPYMEWAKTNFTTPPAYNLASSGLANMTLSEIDGVSLADLEITGKSFYGYEPLQAALSKHTGAPAECIFAATGTSMGNMLSMALTLNPGDEVLFEHPVYDLLVSAAGFLEAEVRYFPRRPENGFAIEADDVAKRITSRTKLIVITNLHNPSMCLTTESTLRDLAALAKPRGIRILSDEVYLDSAGTREKAVSGFEIDPEVFIVTNSLTKVYGLSGFRCGWVLADPEFIRKVWRLNDLFGVIPVHAGERLSVVALQQADRLLARARAILDRNRAHVNGFLEELGEPLLEGGTVAFPRVPDAANLTERLYREHGVAVVPGRFFDMPDRLRIGFGGSEEVLVEGLRRIRLARL